MSIFARLSTVSRTRKLELFNNVLQPTKQMRILDVGAEIDPFSEHSLQFIDSYPWKENITAVNISSEHIARIAECYPEIEGCVGDACVLPWGDNHFDIVYSNAVIEHVGSFEKQKKMASEIMRVGRKWFVTTPNRWYPYEFHMRLPFVTWIPCHAYIGIARAISYNHVAGKYTVGNTYDSLRLMSQRELQQCFPDSRIVRQRVTFMAETLIAIGGDIHEEDLIYPPKEDSQEAQMM